MLTNTPPIFMLEIILLLLENLKARGTRLNGKYRGNTQEALNGLTDSRKPAKIFNR